MSAGNCDHGTGGIDTRSGDDAPIDRTLEAEGWSAHITHSGEAAHQGIRRLLAGQDTGEAEIAHCLRRTGRGQHGMPVRIDQARHQRSPVAGNSLSAFGLNRACRNRRDYIALDQNIRRRRKNSTFSVKDADILEQHVIGAGRGAKSEHESRGKHFSARVKHSEKGTRKKGQRCGAGHGMRHNFALRELLRFNEFLAHDGYPALGGDMLTAQGQVRA
ncbi:hypothetical protein EMEDMD4_790260 [Sinorhizobium medicae]|uniref:Uncharacterized protein n=1 Tax=Sinorhizobium medicae TaxID=110321 RepID=A0A508XAX7_9HYPH|nr:hypothetical protein EMEDMD4_790260 [Sinorhizobium medicae]